MPRGGALRGFMCNKHRTQDKQYHNSMTWGFEMPTANTADVIGLATTLLERIYRKGYKYKKAGIMLLDIIPETQHQGDLFSQPQNPKSDALMAVMDKLNSTMGQDTVFHLAQGSLKKKNGQSDRQWQMHRSKSSPCYTTKWLALPKVS